MVVEGRILYAEAAAYSHSSADLPAMGGPMLEVYQDLTLDGDPGTRARFRVALIEKAETPWRHAPEKEKELRNNAHTAEVAAFERLESSDLPAASLFLRETDHGYYVSNIVPKKIGTLTYRQYNDLLQDFLRRVVAGPAAEHRFQIVVTKAQKALEEFAGADVANALKNFSDAANKATGAAHPLDQRRWHAFVVRAHRQNVKFDAQILARWLQAEGGWSADMAHNLAVEYEQARDLLQFYDGAKKCASTR